MNAEDFILSAIALFVFFFVVTPLLTKICERGEEPPEKNSVTAAKTHPRQQMRRAG